MRIIEKLKWHYRSGTLWGTTVGMVRSLLSMSVISQKTEEMVNNGIKVINHDVFRRMDRNLKILIIKLDHMGDFLLAIPAILRLRDKFRYSDIDIVVGEWNVSLAQQTGIFKHIYTFSFFQDRSSEHPQEKARGEKELLMRLGKYDIAIDLRRQRNTRLLLSKVKADMRVGYRSFSKFDKYLDICLDTELDEVGVVKAHNEINMSLQLIRLVDAIPSWTLSLPKLSNLHSVERQIAIFPTAGNQIKEWPIMNFVELSKRILDIKLADNINIYLLDSEKKTADYFSGIPGINMLIGLDLDSLIKSLSNNTLSIANNSFGSHLSSYLGIPSVAIYGGHETVLEWQPPFGRSTVVYSDVSCSPCHAPDIRSCPYDLICLKQITPAYVVAVIKKQIKSFTEDGEKYLYYDCAK